MFTRKKLLAAARAEGYTGAADKALVKAFLDENGIELRYKGAAVDFDKAWDTKAVVEDTETAEDDAETQTAALAAKEAELKAKQKAVDDLEAKLKKAKDDAKQLTRSARGTGHPGHLSINSPGGFARKAEAASFNAEANRGLKFCPDAETAEVIGAWAKLRWASANSQFESDVKDLDWCREICTAANVSYDFSLGGFVVPQVLSDMFISIRPRYSALSQLLPSIPIPPSGESVPRRSSGVTVYSPGEGVAATESNPAGDQVKLTPFEMVALITVSKIQLLRSNISFGEFITNEMNYALQKKMEEIYIKGDGTVTYFNQVGLLGKLSKQVTDAGGTWTIGTNATNAEYHSACVRGTGAWSAITYDDLEAVKARPALVENPGQMVWLTSFPFYQNVMVKAARSKGGVPTSEIINGIPTPMYEGNPVIFSNAMPQITALSTVSAYFGDFATCTKVGEVPQTMELLTSDQAYWTQRKIGYQLSVHKALNAHDLGTANSTTPTQTVPFAFIITTES